MPAVHGGAAVTFLGLKGDEHKVDNLSCDFLYLQKMWSRNLTTMTSWIKRKKLP